MMITNTDNDQLNFEKVIITDAALRMVLITITCKSIAGPGRFKPGGQKFHDCQYPGPCKLGMYKPPKAYTLIPSHYTKK